MENLTHKSVADALLNRFKDNTDTAIICRGQPFSYQAMLAAAEAFIGDMSASDNNQSAKPRASALAIICDKSIGNYVAILACLLSARTYVPINPKAPIERIEFILEESQCQQLYIDETLKDEKTETLIGHLANKNSAPVIHRAISWQPQARSAIAHRPMVDAYIMYTSGSTGTPKGVPISQTNLASYVANISDVFNLSSTDRCTQMFDLTFDLSVHDIVLTWLAGACLCVPSTTDTFAPAKFINQYSISVWFSVPSTIDIMQRLKLLKPKAFPTLRLSLFCGEALAGSSVQQWLAAAPNSDAINLYGPTEATIACCFYRIDKSLNPQPNSIPIGRPFGRNATKIIDGELNLAGPQLTAGYINNTAKNAEQFHHLDDERWYRSGDNASTSADGDLIHLGRSDDQIKINGHRIELQEITHTIKRYSSDWNLKAVAFSPTPLQPPVIYLFVEKPLESTVEALSAIESTLAQIFKQHLVDYMRPKKIRWIDTLPLNSNGKVDKNSLLKILETCHENA